VLRLALRLPWTGIAALLALVLAGLHALQLENIIGSYTACRGCFALPTFANDAWLLAAQFAFLALASSSRRRWIRGAAGALAALILLACALDQLSLRLFTQRLYVDDVLRFATQSSSDWSVARTLLVSANGIFYAAFGLMIALTIIGLVAAAQRSPRLARVIALSSAALLLLAILARTPLHYVNNELAANLVEANLPHGSTKPYSQPFADAELQRSKLVPLACDTAGGSISPSVVIVITESLSAYQSALLGGPQNWLPRLDALARDNHYFTHFYANGFNTIGGEVAALTGRPPLPQLGSQTYALAAFGPDKNTLPAIVHSAGYTTHYFTTSDLDYEQTGTWLNALGFDSVEGSENAYYAGMPRGEFNAAEDAALFGRFEQWLAQRRDPRPFVAVLLTVTSHPPFADPRTGRLDAQETFAYVDEQLDEFHAWLQRRGFFTNGVLMITGDHRSMTPLLAEEYRDFGKRALARIPLVVAGAVDMPRVVEAAFSQSDIPASLAHLLGIEHCRSPFNGYFLDPLPVAPQFVIHARGDDRDRVSVYSGITTADYFEDGDASRWLDAGLPQADLIAGWLVAQRMREVPPLTNAKAP
jgi:arylsulfatase A-like enzyme